MNEANEITVLIVNDDRLMCTLWDRVINHEPGMVCVGSAYNGFDAIKLASKHHPDVVLMDVMMSGMDGIEATHRIIEEHPQTAVIVFTAGVLSIEKVRKSGAVSFFNLPLNPDELGDTIRDGYSLNQQSFDI